jgi:hypothetical protein
MSLAGGAWSFATRTLLANDDFTSLRSRGLSNPNTNAWAVNHRGRREHHWAVNWVNPRAIDRADDRAAGDGVGRQDGATDDSANRGDAADDNAGVGLRGGDDEAARGYDGD